MFCAYCGTELAAPDAAFCSRCGAPVSGVVTRETLVRVGTRDLPLAGNWQRVGGFAVDGVLLYFLSAIPMFAVFYATGFFDYMNDPACFDPGGRLEPACTPDVSGLLWWGLIVYPLTFLYWWVSNTMGVSIGKLAAGARIVRADGSRPGIGRGLLRTAVALVSGYVFFLGYLWAFWDARRQTWHDKAAGTYVVRVRP
ncbi:MAG: RDD family protein [Dehalococcoidia bacterium]